MQGISRFLAVGFHDQGHAALGGKLDGVAQQVHQHLAQPDGIGGHPAGQVRTQPGGQGQPLFPSPVFQGTQDILQKGLQGEFQWRDIQLAGFDLGEVQDVVDDGEQMAGRGAHQLQVFSLFFVQIGAQGQFGHPDHTVHGRANLVAHVGQELALHPVRGLGGLLGAPQRLLGLLALGDVPGHQDAVGEAVQGKAGQGDIAGKAATVGPGREGFPGELVHALVDAPYLPLGQQLRHLHAHQLMFGMAEQVPRRRVGGFDHAVGIDRHQGIGNVAEHRLQALLGRRCRHLLGVKPEGCFIEGVDQGADFLRPLEFRHLIAQVAGQLAGKTGGIPNGDHRPAHI